MKYIASIQTCKTQIESIVFLIEKTGFNKILKFTNFKTLIIYQLWYRIEV